MTIVDVERRNRVALLRFNLGKSGTMSARTASALLKAMELALDDDGIRVIVLTGALPDMFIKHYSVEEVLLTAKAIRADPSIVDSAASSPVASLYQTCGTASKPIIAAINGTCMGGGFELALCCARRVLQSDVTQIGLPETRIGIIPGGGGTQRLPRLIGEAKALQFILDGEVVDARRALALGLVDELADDTVARAMEIAEQWGRQSSQLLTATLATVRGATNRSLEDGAHIEAKAFLKLLLEDDVALQRMQHFVDGNLDLGTL